MFMGPKRMQEAEKEAPYVFAALAGFIILGLVIGLIWQALS